MELLQEAIVAFFAAVGIAWCVWSAAQALLLAKWEQLEPCVMLVAAKDDAPALEETVAALLALRLGRQPLWRILIVDCGLSAPALARARQLAAAHEKVTLRAKGAAGEKKDET